MGETDGRTEYGRIAALLNAPYRRGVAIREMYNVLSKSMAMSTIHEC